MGIGRFAAPATAFVGCRSRAVFDRVSCARRRWRFSIYSLYVPDEKPKKKAWWRREKADDNNARKRRRTPLSRGVIGSRRRLGHVLRVISGRKKYRARPAAFRRPYFLSSIFPDHLIIYRFGKKKLQTNQSRVLWFAKIPRKQNRRSIPGRNIARP